jgi:hypothetical protein
MHAPQATNLVLTYTALAVTRQTLVTTPREAALAASSAGDHAVPSPQLSWPLQRSPASTRVARTRLGQSSALPSEGFYPCCL